MWSKCERYEYGGCKFVKASSNIVPGKNAAEIITRNAGIGVSVSHNFIFDDRRLSSKMILDLFPETI